MRKKFAALVALAILACTGVEAGSRQKTHIAIQATQNEDGSFKLRVEPGDPDEIEANAILVVSQPSNTILAAVLDETFLQTREGRSLQANLDKSALSQVTGDLKRTKPTVLLPTGPPVSDEIFQVLMYGSFEGIEMNGFQAINARVVTPTERPTSFGLSATMRLSYSKGGGTHIETCCKCGNPPQDCGCQSDCGSPFCDCVNCSLTCD